MMPAAPLVGAVTTRPPVAFSSLTASAYRLTQSSVVSGSFWLLSACVSKLRCRAAPHLHRAGQRSFLFAAALDAVLHDIPDAQQAAADVFFGAPDFFVFHHQLADRNPIGVAQGQ